MVESAAVHSSSYGTLDGLSVSSVGLGTYLGGADAETDLLYAEAVVEAVRLGCNVVDTAINYRHQRSERAIGAALARLERTSPDIRAQVVLATKGGYVAFDGEPPPNRDALRKYLDTTFFVNGICSPADMAGGLQHCMAPAYLAHEIGRSLANLGVDAVDIYYVHNPETQLPEVGREEFDRRVARAFEELERKVAEGVIGRYGMATWNGFRVAPSDPRFLSLERLVEIARTVGGEDHGFRVIQLPYNLAMPEAFASFNQPFGEEFVSTLEAARRLGVSVIASASLLQARLADELPPEVERAFRMQTSAQDALQFVRSTPGVACALVGMARSAHVRENLSVLENPPSDPSAIYELFDDA